MMDRGTNLLEAGLDEPPQPEGWAAGPEE